jgi:hypothetical protein
MQAWVILVIQHGKLCRNSAGSSHACACMGKQHSFAWVDMREREP